MKHKQSLLAVMAALLLILGGVVWWGYGHLTGLVESVLRREMGPDVSIGQVDMKWNRVAVKDVRLKRSGPGNFPYRIRIDRVTITPSLRSFFSGRFQIGTVRVERPVVLIEIAPDGKVIRPLPEAMARRRADEAKKPFAVSIGDLEVVDGTVELLDWQVARHGVGTNHPRERYHLLHFPKMEFTAGPIDMPFSQGVPLRLDLQAPVTGTFRAEGTVNPATLDGAITITLRNWDITYFRPYYQKPGDMTVTRGNLSADCTIKIAKRHLNAPGRVYLKELEVEGAGAKGVFLGLPAKGVIAFMKGNNEEISVDFNVSGSIDDPKFKVRQAFRDRIAAAFASKMGVPVLSKEIVDLGSKGIEGIKELFGGKK